MKRKRAKKPVPDPAARATYLRGSPEAEAIKVLHDIVGRERAFIAIFRASDGSVTFTKPMTDQLRAFAQAPEQSCWVTLNFPQACAWEEFLGKVFDRGVVRQRLHENSKAPWPWPPSLEGTIYPDPGGVPPLRDDDINALASEGQK